MPLRGFDQGGLPPWCKRSEAALEPASNTAPPNYTENMQVLEFKTVHYGIDSLYLSFKGTLKKEMLKELEMRKEYAQSEDENEQALASIVIDDHLLEVKDKGMGRYAYILEDNWYQIKVSSGKGRIPPVYVQLKSELLNCFGVYNAINQLRGLLKELIEETTEELISRADLFVDFVTNADLGSIRRTQWVCRAKKTGDYWSGKEFTGLSIGQGGQISARLYNKTLEIESSYKDFFKPLWIKNEWDQKQTVWRLEFQLRREVLNQFSISKLIELTECSNDVWRYCTNDWLRLVDEEEAKNRTRLETHPLWNEIQQVKFGPGNYTGITRNVSRSRKANMKAICLNGLGYITGYAAEKGHVTVDNKVMLELLTAMKDFLKEYTKNSPKYDGPEAYIQAKVNLKKKKYNRPLE